MKKSKKTKVKNKNTNTNKNVNKNNIHIHIGDTKKKSKRKKRKTATRQQPALTAIYPTAQVIGGGIPQKQIVFPPTNKPEYNLDPIINREREPQRTYDRANYDNLSDISLGSRIPTFSDISFRTQEPFTSNLYDNISTGSNIMRSNSVNEGFSNQDSVSSGIYQNSEQTISPIHVNEEYVPQLDDEEEVPIYNGMPFEANFDEDEVVPFRIITDTDEFLGDELDPKVTVRDRAFTTQEPTHMSYYDSILQNAENIDADIESRVMPETRRHNNVIKGVEKLKEINDKVNQKSFFTKMKELMEQEKKLKAELATRQKQMIDTRARLQLEKSLEDVKKAKAEEFARIKELEKNARVKYPNEKEFNDDIDIVEMLLESKKNDKNIMSQEHLQLYNKVSQNLSGKYYPKLSYKTAYEKLNTPDIRQRIANIRPSKPEKAKTGNILGSNVEFTPGGNIHQLNSNFV